MEILVIIVVILLMSICKMSSLDSCNCSFRSLQLTCLDGNLPDRNVSEFSQEDQELLWLRSGIDEVANASICYLHQRRLLVDFIKNQKKTCADIFNVHASNVATKRKTNAKGVRVVSLDLSKQLFCNGFRVIPGQKLCKRCYLRAEASSEEYFIDSESNVKSSQEDFQPSNLDSSAETVRECFDLFDESPLSSMHGVKYGQKRKLVQEKVSNVRRKLFEELSTITNVNVDDFIVDENTERSSLIAQIKKLNKQVQDFNCLLETLKEKHQETTDIKLKQQILTCTPKSWSRKQAADFFGVTEHQIRMARNTVQEKGILEQRFRKRKSGLPQQTIEKVKEFF